MVSPFQYQTFRNAGRLKYIYTAVFIVGVLLPCVPAIINAAFGYGIMTFSNMLCIVAVQDVGFYTDGLTEGIEIGILGTLQALVFMKLIKVGITTVVRPNIAGFQFYFVCMRGFTLFFVCLFICFFFCLFFFFYPYIYLACCKEAHREGK